MTSALASGCAEIRTDPFMRYLESVSIETLLSAEEQAELLQTYENEFAYLQQKYGEPIQTVSESVIGRIKCRFICRERCVCVRRPSGADQRPAFSKSGCRF